jgi:hypothetical protein
MKYGKIIWIKEPLMLYRIHKGQDSGQFSYKDQQELILYYSKILYNGKKNRLLKKYRVRIICIMIIRRLKQNKKISFFIIKQMRIILLYYSPFNLFKHLILKKFFKIY